jgi:hypothetical protein
MLCCCVLQILSSSMHVIQCIAYSIFITDRLPSYFLFQSHSRLDDSDVSIVT